MPDEDYPKVGHGDIVHVQVPHYFDGLSLKMIREIRECTAEQFFPRISVRDRVVPTQARTNIGQVVGGLPPHLLVELVDRLATAMGTSRDEALRVVADIALEPKP